jgi:hypothetical protein
VAEFHQEKIILMKGMPGSKARAARFAGLYGRAARQPTGARVALPKTKLLLIHNGSQAARRLVGEKSAKIFLGQDWRPA